jgi:DNA processing protein
MDDASVYKIALSLIPKVGPILARSLVAYTGSVEAVFKEKKSHLLKVPGIGDGIVSQIDFKSILAAAETELKLIEKEKTNWLFYLDKEYPNRLKECDDSPIVIFYKGDNWFNAEKLVSIVGTRRSTVYGDMLCKKLVSELAEMFPELVIVSGFAYGIDIASHKAAFKSNLATIAVFGHGLDMVYPSLHRKYVSPVLDHGAIVSEFTSQKKLDPGNFVSRNRIIAGLADATVVVESGEKGGALITADMANSYNRDVFAFPGKVGDAVSKGCNNLIKQNKAILIESATDLVTALRWDVRKQVAVQKELFCELSVAEEKMLSIIRNIQPITLDQIAREAGLPVSNVSASLLEMEFKGLVKALPGKAFKLA